MIEKKAEYISEKLVEKNLVKNKDKDVYQYGIEVLISTAINIMLLLVIGIIVANIPKLTVTHLFLMYGTLRAATLLPTIFTLRGVKLKPESIVVGIVSALIIGLPVFAYGNIKGNAMYKTIGSLITVLLSGTVALIVSRNRGDECE